MPNQSYVLQMGDSFEWVNSFVQAIEDGHLQPGISRLYQALTAGAYSGTTSISVNGKTDVKPNACVLDRRSGLIWTAAPAASVGPASNGKLYWDDRIARLGFSDNIGSAFVAGEVVTQAVTAATGLIRYVANTPGHLALESVENGPFDTVNRITAPGGGDAKVDSYATGNKEDVFEFARQANLAGLAGFEDWRVPNIFEMVSIMLFNVTKGNARPDASFFSSPGTSDLVWTSTHDIAERGLHAVAPRFDNGGMYAGTASEKAWDTGYLYLVRGPDLSEDRYCLPLRTDFAQMSINFFCDAFYRLGVEKSFTILDQGQHAGSKTFSLWNGDSHTIENKAVMDENTGLMWLFAESDHDYPYYDDDGKRGDALEYMRILNAYGVGGYTDWRTPTLFEYLSVYDASTERIRAEVAKDPSLSSWSCTPDPGDTDLLHYAVAGRPWSYTAQDRLTGGPFYVRAVRAGKWDADLPA